MSDTVESNVIQYQIFFLKKQCEDHECLIHMLEDAYKQSLGETKNMEIQFKLEEDKVLSLNAKIMSLEKELLNIKGFYNLI